VALPMTVVRYGPVNAAGGGKEAEATILSKEGPDGETPKDMPPIWTKVKDRRTSGKRTYVQGHLLNRKLHGLGRTANLSPITYSANANHEVQAESEIKRRVFDEKQVLKYKITAEYGKHPEPEALLGLRAKANLDAKESQQLAFMEAEQDLPTKIFFVAHKLGQDAQGKWTVETETVVDDHIDNEIPTDLPTV